MTLQAARAHAERALKNCRDPEKNRRPGGGPVHSVVSVPLEHRQIHVNAEALRILLEATEEK